MNSYWVQVDVGLDHQPSRFYMNDCGGRDHVVLVLDACGWREYEPPLPETLAKLCRGLQPVFLDVGANTGYYALLAASTGASRVYAFEPVPSIYQIMVNNVAESGLGGRIHTLQQGVGESVGSFTLYMPDARHGLIETSASLNKDFRSNHSDSFEVPVTTLDAFGREYAAELANQPVLIKIDVETLEPQVLMGGQNFLAQHRPVIAVEILPGDKIAYFNQFCSEQDYVHIRLRPGEPMDVWEGEVQATTKHRDHLLIPREKAGAK